MDIKICYEKISSKANNPETERNFRANCLWYKEQCSTSGQPLSQDYQEYVNLFHRITSLYLIIRDIEITKLVVYDTECEREVERILKTPLSSQTSITQLPNGELFCYGTYPPSGVTLIIDLNYKVNILPHGKSCYFSSGVYFNNNIYCFGGRSKYSFLTLSRKFDLNENRWINLTSMPRADSICHSVIFNGNILISGYDYENLLIYSPDINSFSTIHYDFGKTYRKILIYIEKLYLIVCYNQKLIYESEDEYNWKPISTSIIDGFPAQVCWSYNKGGIYIKTSFGERYYKFDLSEKIMTKFM